MMVCKLLLFSSVESRCADGTIGRAVRSSVLLIVLWRPAARRARNLATPLATRERLFRGAYP